jgi:putative chitinase
LVIPLNQYLPDYGITTILRISNFLGQAAEETAYFRTLTEYASGREYEGRHDLGNIYAGDGVKFRGRGIFQITGRANYGKADEQLGLGNQLVSNPLLAASPDIAVRTACEYWKARNMNEWADQNNIHQITRLINGGYNGLAVRTQLTNKANQWIAKLAQQAVPAPVLIPAPITVPPLPAANPDDPNKPLDPHDPVDIISSFVHNSLEQTGILSQLPVFMKEGL